MAAVEEKKARKELLGKNYIIFFSVLSFSAYVVECLSVVIVVVECGWWKKSTMPPNICLSFHFLSIYTDFFPLHDYVCIYSSCGVLVLYETLYIAWRRMRQKTLTVFFFANASRVWWTTFMACREVKVWCHKMNLLSEVKPS